MSASNALAAERPRPLERLWNRSLAHYPSNATRYTSLGIVVLTTIVLYYQLYLSGGVAAEILRSFHMSFTYYVNISVIGYLLGAAASIGAGLADRYGRANIVAVGLGVVGLLCLFALPAAHSKFAFGLIYVIIGFVEGIILVATPALVRDFSPQLGRASAMGFWTLGPVLGSLVVAAFVSSNGGATWQHQYRISGIIGLVVFAIALIGLRELSPGLRDQLMVSSKDRELIEARAVGVDIEASLRKPYRQMLHLDILGSAFAISVFLIIYYVAVGFFPIFFESVFGYSASKANGLGDYFWAFDAAGLLVVGVISDWLRVRKPFMVLGAVLSIIFTVIFATRATHPHTSHGTFVLLLSCIAVSLAMAFAPWMASFTETVERRNPALIATGLSVWGLVIRVVIAVSVFFVPKVVTTATTLVEQGPVVQSVLASPAPVGHTTVGAVATSVAAHPATVAKLQAVAARNAALVAALKSHPTVAAALAQAQAAKVTPTPAQLAQVRAAIGPQAFAELIKPTAAADLAFLSVTAPKTLGAAQFAALSAPNAALASALATLQKDGPPVASAAKRSPKQWRTFFLIGAAGELVFIPLILLMAGFWDPRKAKRAEEEHDAWLAAEMAKLRANQGPAGAGAPTGAGA
ncbi:MAG TPA: MFS transporter [Solirubrobacteraceae bacterium]|nr:MFS transporter [Solirubrobacteraceae bacterium]